MLNDILAVTDFSANSLRIVPPVVALARAFQSTVSFCHVDEEEEFFSAHSSDDLVAFLENIDRKRRDWLADLAAQAAEMGLETDTVRLKGYASREITRYAQDKQVGLTAISALGSQGFKALLMGSTASNVLRHLMRPVLFVGAHCTPAEDYNVQKVLYPTDFSDISRKGAQWAARLCRKLDAHLLLLHVMKLPTYIPALPGEPPVVLPSRLVDSMNGGFQEMIASLAAEIETEDISCEVSVAVDEADEICSKALSGKVDLIVIPKRGQGVLEGLLFGRVAESVARLSPVPTILFHPDEVES